ncbi:MAG: thermonuclease [Desulfuromusa sp.]|nr:thermonuclease [Desulfuromusa sp.]
MLTRSALFLFLLLLLATTVSAEKLTGRVLWVYDGDTLKIEDIGKVRLIGIDTPEIKASPRDRFYTKKFHINPGKLRQIAQQTKNYNIHYVKGKKVRLELDQTVRDKYNRLLAYVYLPDGEMLNLLLLKKGWATVFRRYDFVYKKDFLKAERKARKKGLGLWND